MPSHPTAPVPQQPKEAKEDAHEEKLTMTEAHPYFESFDVMIFAGLSLHNYRTYFYILLSVGTYACYPYFSLDACAV